MLNLKKLLEFQTAGNAQGISDCLNFVKETLQNYGFKTVIVKNEQDQKENLIAVLNGELKNICDGLLLAGHIDTVNANAKNWNSNPFTLTQNGNDLIGLGIADMKSFTAAVLDNLKKISELKLKKPLMFVLTNDEETVMYSIQRVCDYFKQNSIVPNYAIVGEPSNMMFSNSNKGFYEFETTIFGKAAHSSNPQLGVNAIYIMAKLIGYLQSLAKEYQKYETTLNVGLINGGRMCNIVPDKCTIRWDVRTNSNQIVEQIDKKVNAFLEDLILDNSNSSFDNQIVFQIPAFEERNVKITITLMQNYNITQHPYKASTEAGFYQQLGIDCIIYGCGDIEQAHAPNEKIDLDKYNQYCQNLLEFIKDICC